MGRTACDQARERISLELDGELSLHEAALLDRHLSTCPGCALFADDVRRHTELLRAAPLEEAPQFVLPRRATAARRLSVRVGAAVGSTAAAALVAISVLSFGKPPASHPRVVALDFVPKGAVVERAANGVRGLRHPTAVTEAERPNLGLQDASQHGLVDN
jgi:predicted anti-sigma-YlaC factor YlaD